MATNPMQRKIKNSFMLGMALMFVISAVIIAILGINISNNKKVEIARNNRMRRVYVLTQDVKSGNEITADMIVQQEVDSALIPANAWGDTTIFDGYSLRTKDGREIKTEYKDGKPQLYIEAEVDGEMKKYRVTKEEDTENYYIGDGNKKQYLELDTVPIRAKVTMNANTLLTAEMIYRGDSIVLDDVRREEYNIVSLPADLATADFIDIRLEISGQNYIVVSKKEVEIPEMDGIPSSDTLWVELSEDEILYMSDAILTAASVPGSRLYAVKYTEPGMQAAGEPTYVINEETKNLIEKNPNIVQQAKEVLFNRLNDNQNLRTNINNAINQVEEETRKANIQTKLEESITKALTTRKEYLEKLSEAAGN